MKPTMKRLYRNAQLASDNGPLVQADLLVEGDRIIGVGANLPSADAEVIDCSGRIILPGLCDLHVHAREPGQESREDIRSCSEAAINGGITAMVLQPDTSPAVDSGAAVQAVLESAKEKSRIAPGIFTAGAITKGRNGEELAGIAGMKARGVAYLTDGGEPVCNPQVLRRAMEYAAQFELVLASHCETKELSGKGSMHEGSVSYSLGLQGIPAISEDICITRDIRLAQYAGVPLHIQHVSTKEGLKTIWRAKKRDINVTCEVTPHHLIFDHSHIGNFNTNFKVNPPLRTPKDNAALLAGLKKGRIDYIASGHSPHTLFEKNQDFASAPFGITGLETALVSLYHYFIKPGHFDWDLLVRHYSTKPRALLKLESNVLTEGSLAEFVVFNPGRRSTFNREFMKSKSINTPFLDQTLDGLVERVYYRGEELLSR
jgi:dihydroorotase